MAGTICIFLFLAVALGVVILLLRGAGRHGGHSYWDNRPDDHPRLHTSTGPRRRAGPPPPPLERRRNEPPSTFADMPNYDDYHNPDFYERTPKPPAESDSEGSFLPPTEWTGNESQHNAEHGSDFKPYNEWKPDGYQDDDSEELLWALEAESPHDPMTEPTISQNILGGEDHDYRDGTIVEFDGHGRLFRYIIDGLDVDEELSRRKFRDLQ